MLSCVDCVAGFVSCVVVLVGEESWLFGGVCLCSIVCLCVGCLVGGLASRVLGAVLVGERLCVRRGGCLRLPALKISVFAI